MSGDRVVETVSSWLSEHGSVPGVSLEHPFIVSLYRDSDLRDLLCSAVRSSGLSSNELWKLGRSLDVSLTSKERADVSALSTVPGLRIELPSRMQGTAGGVAFTHPRSFCNYVTSFRVCRAPFIEVPRYLASANAFERLLAEVRMEHGV